LYDTLTGDTNDNSAVTFDLIPYSGTSMEGGTPNIGKKQP
jgi:hypothetical protein